jgi:hypothetical protein
MKDAWDIIILFLIAAIVGCLLYVGAIVGFKKVFNSSNQIETPTSRPAISEQKTRMQNTRQQQKALMREQKRRQKEAQQRLKDKMRNMKR